MAPCARQRGDLGQVVQAQRGIGEGFDPDHAGGRCQAGLQTTRGGIHHRDAPALTQRAQQAFGPTIQRAQEHQFVPGFNSPSSTEDDAAVPLANATAAAAPSRLAILASSAATVGLAKRL